MSRDYRLYLEDMQDLLQEAFALCREPLGSRRGLGALRR